MDQFHMAETQGTPSLNPRYCAHVHRGVLCNAARTTNIVIYLHVLWIICIYYV
jgi:hypothetical protein